MAMMMNFPRPLRLALGLSTGCLKLEVIPQCGACRNACALVQNGDCVSDDNSRF